MTATIVTAFYDIGRSDWGSPLFRRSVDEYMEAFSNLLRFDYPMIIFIDSRYHNRVLSMVESSEYKHNKVILPIDENWMNQNIWVWGRLGREREIMQSEEYQRLIPRRIEMCYPENVNPMYTILTHSKVDFLCHAIENDLTNSRFLMWVDFGYLSQKAMRGFIPHRHLDCSKMIEGKIILCCLNGGLNSRDFDIIYTLQKAPEKMAGGVFVGDRDSLIKFREISHNCLLKYQELNLADDEQALWIQCLSQEPSLFSVHIFDGWHYSLRYFTKDTKE